MVFYKNTKELNYIFNRKLFKKNVFHRDNIEEEEYYWDDYDTTYGYKINTLANCLIGVKKTTIHSNTPYPTHDKPTQTPYCLPRPQIKKILLSNSSTQFPSNTIVCNSSTQTHPKLYLHLNHNPNINIQPFNTNLFLR